MSFHSYHPSVPSNQSKVACERVIRWKCLGSGDPPGLQNRRSSLTGDGVFDSHALPPATCAPEIAQRKAIVSVVAPEQTRPCRTEREKLEDSKAFGALRI